MSDINLHGLRFWRVLRCSEDEQEAESFPQQRMTTDECAKRFGIVVVATKELAGHSATQGQQVEPLLAIIKRKIDGEDFDGLLFDSYSRFARTDADEARLYAECRDANLLIVTDKEGQMMGPGTWAKRGSATDQNEGYARELGRNVNRAVGKLINDELIPPTFVFPWGLDREYYDGVGQALFRVRRQPDGRKAVLDPETPHAVRYFISHKKGRLNLRESECSFKWVPGDPELQALARRAFRQYYLEGVTAASICAEFNRLKVPTRSGTMWRVNSIQSVLHNPLWIGFSVGGTKATGHHGERTASGPKMFAVSKRPGYRNDKKRRKSMKVRLKPVAEWVIFEQPKMVSFLDEDVRKAAESRWQSYKDNFGKVLSKPRTPRNFPSISRYFLSKLITLKDEGLPMIGTDGGSNSRGNYRYYLSRREQQQPEKGRPNERVRADLVEDEVKAALREVLSNFDVHAPTVTKYIESKKREILGRRDDTSELRLEKRQLEDWYRSAFSVVGARGKQLLAGEAERVLRRLDQIDTQLNLSDEVRPDYLDCTSVEVTRSLHDQFKELAAVIDEMPVTSLRNLVAVMCPKITFDPVARIVEIEVPLPSRAVSREPRITKRVGTQDSSASIASTRTESQNIPLYHSKCVFEKKLRYSKCGVCQRARAA